MKGQYEGNHQPCGVPTGWAHELPSCAHVLSFHSGREGNCKLFRACRAAMAPTDQATSTHSCSNKFITHGPRGSFSSLRIQESMLLVLAPLGPATRSFIPIPPLRSRNVYLALVSLLHSGGAEPDFTGSQLERNPIRLESQPDLMMCCRRTLDSEMTLESVKALGYWGRTEYTPHGRRT